MPRPRNHDDEPRCDECDAYGEWHDGEQAHLCEMCEPEPVPQEDETEPCEYDESNAPGCENIDATWFA